MKIQAASTSQKSAFLQPFWTALIGPPWLVSLATLFVIAGIRYIAVLSPYRLQALFFLQAVCMWAIPFVMMTPAGRRQIGLTERGVTPASIVLSGFVGALCGLILFSIGMALYGLSPDNWCVSLRSYIHLDDMSGLMSPIGLFALYALPAILINPVGEEILFRGLIQQSFTRRFDPIFATFVSSLSFGLTYLYLHGLWHDGSGFHIRLVSAIVGILLMSTIGCVFTVCRMISGSLWLAIASHAAFNLTLLALTIHKFLR